MQLSPYFNFNGNAEEALNFYAKALGGKIAFSMKWGESPMAKEVPAEFQNKLMHGSVCLGNGALIMGCDAPPERYKPAGGGATSIAVEKVDEAKRIFDELSAGGTVFMPFGPTFWAEGFGMFKDKYGIPWMVNCEKPMDAQA